MSEDIDRIKKENKELKQRLMDYKSIEEDLMARRVFDKARKLLTIYLTFGGLLLLLSGIVGIKSLVDYAKSQAKSKVESISKEQIATALQEEGRQQIAAMVKEREAEFIQIAQQQVTQIVVASKPIAKLSTETGATSSPSQLDHSPDLTPVRDQGEEGGSVGFAVAAALEYQVTRLEGQLTAISPRFIYYYARKKGGFSTGQDTGAYIRDAVSILLERGAVGEEVWPYKVGEFANEPPANVSTAKHYKVKNVQTVGTVEQLKSALTIHGPVPGGITLFRSVNNSAVTGQIQMPGTDENQLGAHAICFVGFDDDKRLFKFKNSWGKGWGDNGYGYLPYDYVERFLSDAWAFSI